MDKKLKMLESRKRLDNTLALPDLVDEQRVKSLVKDQLLRSSLDGNEGNTEKVLEKRTKEVSNFLDMLRSASTTDQQAIKSHETSQNEWKVKQDTEQLRVMYREGPHGTPFHTLLAEGYADGPIDVCLCVSWESTLYKKWWPQYNIPTFKITHASCVQRICIGEDIALIRVKVTWPVSDREVLLHYFEIEYFKEDLIIVLLNTIPDMENVDVSTHGFSRDGIPYAKDTVRVDLVGGFVLQKVDSNRSYFRVIANMDIKLDFVPPTLINFVARQLIGNGHKLYQKAVGSVATSDEDFRKALKQPMYARIREGLDPNNKLNSIVTETNGRKLETKQSFIENKPVTEIEEEPEQTHVLMHGEHRIEENAACSSKQSNETISNELERRENTCISPEVERALRTLDQAILLIRGRALSDSNQSDCFSINQDIQASKNAAKFEPDCSKVSSSNTTRLSVSQPNFDDEHVRKSMRIDENRITNGTCTVTQPPISESMRKVCVEESLETNGFHENVFSKPPKKKREICCLNFGMFQS